MPSAARHESAAEFQAGPSQEGGGEGHTGRWSTVCACVCGCVSDVNV